MGCVGQSGRLGAGVMAVGMQRIVEVFAGHRAARTRALMPFVCGGQPSVAATGGLIGSIDAALGRAGGGVIEIGLPFSDPIADGPVIAAAMHRALEDGATVGSIFERVAGARDGVKSGLVAMASVSLVSGLGGAAAFTKRAAAAGFDGLIVPDAPLEESAALREAAGSAGLTLSLLVAPTTPPARAERIVAACSGFVYLLARSGVTGERGEAPDISGRVAMLRGMTDLPIACGFGISSAAQVRAVVAHADAAIVGSALVRRIGEAAELGEDVAAAAAGLVSELAEGLGGGAGANRASGPRSGVAG